MKKLFTLLLSIVLIQNGFCQEYELSSPDNNLIINISIDNDISYAVSVNGYQFLLPSKIEMTVDGKVLGVDPGRPKTMKEEVKTMLHPVISLKNAEIEDHYNTLNIKFRKAYGLEFRAYNDGVAYRFYTEGKDREVKVDSELVEYNFKEDFKLFFPEEESMHTHQERAYIDESLSNVGAERFASTPLLVDLGSDKGKVLITEADLLDYPGMYLKGDDKMRNSLLGKFAHYPLEVKETSDRNVIVTKPAPYLAITKAKRSYPWRVMIYAKQDKDLIASEMIYKLASPSKIGQADWIRPGKVAWDWYNSLNISGVDFKSGVNQNTYKYFIDFASKYGIEYIILDEGWSDLQDVTKVIPEIDMQELTAYAKDKNVGIILWVTWNGLDKKLDEALVLYESWGIKGIKVDFMQRDDQWMVNYYEKIAKKAAEKKMMVDFHGSYKPTGLIRTYPNVLTSEGVKGNENNKWSADITPDHNITLPFIRMVAGPMDFTPGSMINTTKLGFFPVYDKPMSMGTRVHQLAMYVIYESPLQMLAESPSIYLKEPEAMEFLSKVPVTWDKTIPIDGKVGDFVILAREKNEKWYLGAMNDWTPRDFQLELNFLPEGNFKATIYKDGINADKNPIDFKVEEKTVTNSSTLDIHLASGGGYIMVLETIE